MFYWFLSDLTTQLYRDQKLVLSSEDATAFIKMDEFKHSFSFFPFIVKNRSDFHSVGAMPLDAGNAPCCKS